MRSGRFWLTLVYLSAGLLAQGVHSHGGGTGHDRPESRGDCDETRPHVADHEVGDPDEAPSVCPSCQFRGQASILEPVRGKVAVPRVVEAPPADSTERPDGLALRPRCRAPPRELI